MNSMKVTDGISFAIPSDYVRKFLRKADEFKNKSKCKDLIHTFDLMRRLYDLNNCISLNEARQKLS